MGWVAAEFAVDPVVGRMRCSRCPIPEVPGLLPLGGPCRISDLVVAVQAIENRLARQGGPTG
jgi:hypothetical protein